MQGYWKFFVLFTLIAILLVPGTLNAQATVSQKYYVAFYETGLPDGTIWSISLDGMRESSNNSYIVFFEPDGNYTFIIESVDGYTPSPNTFTIGVHGANVSFALTFAPTLYSISFKESGLPAGMHWNVTLDGLTLGSSNSTIIFKVTDGTYNYFIPSVSGIVSSISNGSLLVNGSNSKVLVRFAVSVNFTFVEQGLPSGSHWSVWTNGKYYDSSSAIINISLVNGTYNYLVFLPSNYRGNPISGKIAWNRNFVVIKAYSPVGYYLVYGVLVIALALILFLYLRSLYKTRGNVTNRR